MNQTYYFYKKTTAPDDCNFYDHGRGIAGYTKSHSNMPLLFKGTLRELDKHYDTIGCGIWKAKSFR